MDITKKKVLILGEGVSGRAAFNALEKIAQPFFDMAAGRPDLVVTSPGIAHHAAFEMGVPVISELELGYLLNNSPIIAVTGTNGKTTVTSLIGHILSRKYNVAVGGNIGIAMSEIALKLHEITVIECSSFQLERCYEFKPDIAVFTNVGTDHIDRHGSMSNYINAKLRLVRNQTEDDILICPYELKGLFKETRANVVYSDRDCKVENGSIYFMGERVMIAPKTFPHNLKNIMQAVAVAKLIEIENEDIEAAIKSFKGEPHRLELVSRRHKKKWFDDSKGTNIDACLAATKCMKGDSALILGGSDKGYDYTELFSNLPSQIKEVFVMGEVKNKLISAANELNYTVIPVENMNEAVNLAAKTTCKNVLLSPAAASFDRYKNYKERGEDFIRAIEKTEAK